MPKGERSISSYLILNITSCFLCHNEIRLRSLLLSFSSDPASSSSSSSEVSSSSSFSSSSSCTSLIVSLLLSTTVFCAFATFGSQPSFSSVRFLLRLHSDLDSLSKATLAASCLAIVVSVVVGGFDGAVVG